MLAALIVLVLVMELMRNRRSRATTGPKLLNDHATEYEQETRYASPDTKEDRPLAR